MKNDSKKWQSSVASYYHTRLMSEFEKIGIDPLPLSDLDYHSFENISTRQKVSVKTILRRGYSNIYINNLSFWKNVYRQLPRKHILKYQFWLEQKSKGSTGCDDEKHSCEMCHCAPISENKHYVEGLFRAFIYKDMGEVAKQLRELGLDYQIRHGQGLFDYLSSVAEHKNPKYLRMGYYVGGDNVLTCIIRKFKSQGIISQDELPYWRNVNKHLRDVNIPLWNSDNREPQVNVIRESPPFPIETIDDCPPHDPNHYMIALDKITIDKPIKPTGGGGDDIVRPWFERIHDLPAKLSPIVIDNNN